VTIRRMSARGLRSRKASRPPLSGSGVCIQHSVRTSMPPFAAATSADTFRTRATRSGGRTEDRRDPLDPPPWVDHSHLVTLAAIDRPLASWVRRLPTLILTACFTLSLTSGSALARGHGGGGFGGGHMGGGHFGGGHVGSFGGHFAGRHFGAGHFAGGHFGGQFSGGRFTGGLRGPSHGPFFFHGVHHFHRGPFFFHHRHGFSAFFAFGFPVVVPSYAYPPYAYYYDPYCDPYSPYYDPNYCYWLHRAY